MPKKIAKKAPRNRAAQDATLINIRAAKKRIAALALLVEQLDARVQSIEDLDKRVFALEQNKLWEPKK